MTMQHVNDMNPLDTNDIRVGKAKQLRVRMKRSDAERIFNGASVSARITGDSDDRLTILLKVDPKSSNHFGGKPEDDMATLTIAARHVELDEALPEGFRTLQPYRARWVDGKLVLGIPPGRSQPIKKTWTKKPKTTEGSAPAVQSEGVQSYRTKALVQEINRRVSEDRDMTMEITAEGLLKVLVEYS